MNTASSLILAAVIIGFLIFDSLFHDWDMTLFLARRFRDLINWMAFWR